MNNLIKVEDRIITLRNQDVILDSDVAILYGVDTRRINEAVKNNPENSPMVIFSSYKSLKNRMWSKFSTGSKI